MARLPLCLALLLAALNLAAAVPHSQPVPSSGVVDAALDPLLNLLVLVQARAQEAASTASDSTLGQKAKTKTDEASKLVSSMTPIQLKRYCCDLNTCNCTENKSLSGQCPSVTYDACCTLTKAGTTESCISLLHS